MLHLSPHAGRGGSKRRAHITCGRPAIRPSGSPAPTFTTGAAERYRCGMPIQLTAADARSGRLARLVEAARSVCGVALGVALPQVCAACREPVVGAGLCAACWSKLSFIAPPYCARLGIPFPFDPGPGVLSMEAIADPPVYGRARAAVRFDETARVMVHALKYADRLDLAPVMGRWMAN